MFSFDVEWTCLYVWIYLILLIIMEVFSLEDEDFGGLFITQSVTKSVSDCEESDKSE